MMASLEQALALWRRGLNVFYIPAPRRGAAPNTPGDGKTPERWYLWGEHQTRRRTEAEIRAEFAANPLANIAIPTGTLSGVDVVDVDSREAMHFAARRFPYTPWQTRTARGYHLFYQDPGVRVPNRARIETNEGRLKIDVRGDGGYVIAPGSLHASGAIYREAGDWSVQREQLPPFRPEWIRRPNTPAPVRPPTARPTGDMVDRARRYLLTIPRPEIGHGSDAATLYAACRLVRGFELPDTDAIALLWEWAGGRSGWTHDWIVSKVAHAHRYGTEPIGALR